MSNKTETYSEFYKYFPKKYYKLSIKELKVIYSQILDDIDNNLTKWYIVDGEYDYFYKQRLKLTLESHVVRLWSENNSFNIEFRPGIDDGLYKENDILFGICKNLSYSIYYITDSTKENNYESYHNLSEVDALLTKRDRKQKFENLIGDESKNKKK